METERLILRRWKAADLDKFAEMSASPEVMEYFPARLSRDESHQFIRWAEDKFERQGFGFWATELKSTGAFIGFVGLNVPNFKAAFTPCVEIGWRLAKEHWGNGYATEAANACLDYAFNQAGLTEILSWTYRGNLRSRHVMERIGMQRNPIEDFDHPALPANHSIRPHVLYRITRAGYS
jgi:RimJ/RimL family protein N-acetyltransferase